MGILTSRRLNARLKAAKEAAARPPVVPDAERTATKRVNVAESRAEKAEAENEKLKAEASRTVKPQLIEAPARSSSRRTGRSRGR